MYPANFKKDFAKRFHPSKFEIRNSIFDILRFALQPDRRPKKRPVKSRNKLHWNLMSLIMAIYEILIVGAAFSRDFAMIAIKRLFFAAESRSHEELMQI